MITNSLTFSLRSKDGEWIEKPLELGKTIIGRSPNVDCQLEDASISREHCQIEVTEEAVFLMDMGSGNGTFIGKERLNANEPFQLKSGQVFRIGMCQARVNWETEEVLLVPSEEKIDAASNDLPETQLDQNNLSSEPQLAEVKPAGVMLQLRHESGGWERNILTPGEYILGRTNEADLWMPDQKVSRKHAKITVNEDGTVSIMDLGSANGTQIDNNPLKPRVSETFEQGQLATIAGYEVRLAEMEFDPLALVESENKQVSETVLSESQSITPPHILRYQQGEGSWQEFPLADGEHIIGRSDKAHLQLDSNLISRQHARIFVEDGRFWLTDMNSRNGVQLLGEPLPPDTPQEISFGQQFVIGDFLFELAQPSNSFVLDFGLGPKIIDSLVQAGSGDSQTEKTMIGAEVGIDMAAVGMDTTPASVNLAGHERVTIGRAPDNMINLDHPLVSRYHAVIERMGTRTRIMDLHSANGIFINGKTVDALSWLKPGDTIKIGPYLIAFTGNELRTSKEQSYNIDVIGLQKWVSKETNLLKEISLNIGENEFVALVGMSGAGKSTLMDAINGFRPATHGQVFVNGVDLYQNYNQFRDEIGNVPQRDIVHMELTAEQALGYAAELRMPTDASEEDRQKAIGETLEDLGLTYRKDLLISRLSGGQIKRVSIGVELLTKPRLFFLDEPTSGLDPGTEYEMMKLLRRLADQGRTIMLITHATKNVMFCDKAIILANRGNLAFYGPPEEALIYFDQFRNHRERLEKDMEFDDIYRILEDTERGRPEEWNERYLESEYARYTVPKQAGTMRVQENIKPSDEARKQAGRRVSGLKQLSILSRRYLRCMFQDKVSLILTLSLAPILGLMNFIWGSKLFDPVIGNAAKTMGVWFAVTIMGILVGYIGSIQEFVKEKAIYKRERAVGLKIPSYILSKVWVGGVLAFYQAFFILLFALLLVKPLVTEPAGYVSMYITLILVIFSSFILGLLISTISANANTAQLVMIGAFVPQMLLAGVLQPLHMIVGGKIMSPIVVARWGFENFVNSTGMGDPLMQDPCWSELDREKRNSLSNDEKEDLCVCMGAQLFTNCSEIPGILSEDFYDEEAQTVLARFQPEQPVAPGRLPTPTRRNTPTIIPSPTFMPSPTYLPTPTAWATLTPLPVCSQPNQTNCVNFQNQQEEAGRQMMEYQETRSAQFGDYRDNTENQFESYWEDVGDQMESYKENVGDQIDDFADEENANIEVYAEDNMDIFEGYQGEMEAYSEDLSYYERSRQEAISSAEAILSILWDDYGSAFQGGVIPRMLYIAAITFAQFLMMLVLMKRKDTI